MGAHFRMRSRDDPGRGDVPAHWWLRRLSSDDRATADFLHAHHRRDGNSPIPLSRAGRGIRQRHYEELLLRSARYDVDFLAYRHQQRQHRHSTASEGAWYAGDRHRIGGRELRVTSSLRPTLFEIADVVIDTRVP